MSSMPDYTGIYNVVRGKLRKSLDELPDDDYTMEEDTGIVIPLLLGKVSRNGSPSTYEAITDPDKKKLFDGAVGRIVAARIRPAIQAAENDGAGVIIEREIGDSRKKFAGSNARRSPGEIGGKTVEEQWLDEANEILALFAKQNQRVSPGGSFFAMPGRRRAEERATGYRAIDVRELLLPPRASRRPY